MLVLDIIINLRLLSAFDYILTVCPSPNTPIIIRTDLTRPQIHLPTVITGIYDAISVSGEIYRAAMIRVRRRADDVCDMIQLQQMHPSVHIDQASRN